MACTNTATTAVLSRFGSASGFTRSNAAMAAQAAKLLRVYSELNSLATHPTPISDRKADMAGGPLRAARTRSRAADWSVRLC